MNTNEVLKEIRLTAKSVGLTFKVDHTTRLNGKTCYLFADRNTGITVYRLCTIQGAYQDCCSGYIQSWNGSTFDGINGYN